MQPSELAKPALVIFVAFFVTWRGRAINNPRYTLVPAALAVGLVIFAVEVADLGTAVVLGLAAMGVFFVAGLDWRYVLIAAGIAVLGLGVSIAKEPYRLGRVVRHYDPDFKFVSKFDKAGRIKVNRHRLLAIAIGGERSAHGVAVHRGRSLRPALLGRTAPRPAGPGLRSLG